jgi:thiamine transport system permease protein
LIFNTGSMSKNIRGKGKTENNSLFYIPVALLPLAVITLIFFLPYINALSLGFSGAGRGGAIAEGGFSLPPDILIVLNWTFTQALVSTGFSLLLGLPGAYIAASPRFRHKKLIRALGSVPFALPPILMVLGFVLFWGNSGFINRLLQAFFGENAQIRILYRPGALIFANTCYNFPLVMRLAGDAFLKIRRNYEEAALSLATPRWKIAVRVVLPLGIHAVIASALLVFLYCWTAFALPLVLGGGPGTATLAVEIYRYARQSLNYQSAGLLSFAETVVSACVFALYLFFDGRSRRLTEADCGDVKDAPSALPASQKIYFALLLVLVLGPILSIIADSLLVPLGHGGNVNFSFHNYLASGAVILAALGRSLLLAVVSACISCILAVMLAKTESERIRSRCLRSTGRRFFKSNPVNRFAAISPAISSNLVLALGFLSLYGREASRSFAVLAAMHAVTALPFTFSSIYSGFRAIEQNTIDAARGLGAGVWKRLFSVEIPLSAGNIRSAWGFAACISIGELNAILMLGMEKWETLPLYIYRAAAAYRYDIACAAGALLILSSLGALLISEKSIDSRLFFRN